MPPVPIADTSSFPPGGHLNRWQMLNVVYRVILIIYGSGPRALVVHGAAVLWERCYNIAIKCSIGKSFARYASLQCKCVRWDELRRTGEVNQDH